MIKNNIRFIFLLNLVLLFNSCTNEINDKNIVTEPSNSNQKKRVCVKHSEWKDYNGKDFCAYYSEENACAKFTGRLSIITRLHKGALEEDVFEGGMSSRWLEIKDKSIVYFKSSGEIADRGKCNCKDGILKIDWESGANLPEESRIYFRSADSVELRYYDYPFDFMTLQYDSLKPKTNPTKILGVIHRN